MKIAPIMRRMAERPRAFEQILVHTGQHYNANMSQVFLDELGLPKPDVNLEVGSGSHAYQTAQVLLRFEPVVADYKPDWVLVPGDVNSSLACALVAGKMGIRVAHVEAGLRSFDRRMPEEVNRVLTDHIADLLFTTEPSANENLRREGIAASKVRYVGNAMIDTLADLLPKALDRWPALARRLEVERFILVTLHRPSNVDDARVLGEFLRALEEISCDTPVVFPVHPRTRQRIAGMALGSHGGNIKFVEPLGYLDFLALEAHARLVLTDSGGVQEETTYLGIPCLTARPNTERPVTISAGTNQLVESRYAKLVQAMRQALAAANGTAGVGRQAPELWDGHAAERILAALNEAGA